MHESANSFIRDTCTTEREQYDISVLDAKVSDLEGRAGVASSSADALTASLSGLVAEALPKDVTVDLYPARVTIEGKAFDQRIGDSISDRQMWIVVYNGIHILAPGKYREPGDPGYDAKPSTSNYMVDFLDAESGYVGFTMYCV